MDVLMPQLGETVAEGKIIKWFKSVGDPVAPGENLCEIETDKVTVEVPAISAGVLTAINAEIGTVAPVGAIIAVVSDSSAPAAAPSSTNAPSPAGAAVNARARHASSAPADLATLPTTKRKHLDPFREVDTPLKNFGRARLASGIAVTPLARRLAADAAIDLGRIAGFGAHGRITGSDVEKAIAGFGVAAPMAARPGGFEEPVSDAYRKRPHKLVPIDGMRRTIARRLTEAKTTVPHFYLAVDVETDRVARIREEINNGAPRSTDGTPAYELSLNDFMIKALGLALQRVPRANTIWSDDGILEFEHSDIAVAVAVPGGVLTPVIGDAEAKTISVISNEVKSLASRAKERALQPHEYQGGTTTISNLGMYGIRAFSAIINPPQATILAIGAVQRQAVETADGGVAFAGRISVTLSCDHRVVDGVLGAELLDCFKTLIENPLAMLV